MGEKHRTGKGWVSGLPPRQVGTRRWPACLPSLLMPALLKPLWTKTSENLLLWLMNESPNWGSLMASWRITAVHNFCAGRGRDNTEVEEIHLRRRLFHFLTRNLFPVLFFLPCLCWCSPFSPCSWSGAATARNGSHPWRCSGPDWATWPSRWFPCPWQGVVTRLSLSFQPEPLYHSVHGQPPRG